MIAGITFSQDLNPNRLFSKGEPEFIWAPLPFPLRPMQKTAEAITHHWLRACNVQVAMFAEATLLESENRGLSEFLRDRSASFSKG